MSKTTVFSLMLLVVPSASGAASQSAVIAAGLCEKGVEKGRYPLSQAPAGEVIYADATITKQTDNVPLRKGIAFGFAWKAWGLPDSVHLLYRTSFPTITRPDGTQLSVYDEPVIVDTHNGQFETVDCYQLNENFELVSGEWTLTVLYGELPLVTHTFHVENHKSK